MSVIGGGNLNYYPEGRYRRFWFLRNSLAVAPLRPVGEEPVHDLELFEELHERFISAGEPGIELDEKGAKGFLVGEEPRLAATVRWQHGDTAATRSALEQWAAERGAEIEFDETFDQE
jgi:hypothetical protein